MILLLPIIVIIVLFCPYTTESRGEKPPIATVASILFFTACYLFVAFTAGSGEDRLGAALAGLMQYGLLPANVTWYSPLTHLFLHADIFHLLSNLFVLWLFGACVERLTGPALFALILLGTGYLSGLGYLHMNPSYLSHVPTIGASGAIAGLMGFTMMAAPGAMVVFFSALPPHRFKLPAFLILLAWFGVQIAYGLDEFGRIEQESARVNYWAHVFGFAAGVLAGLAFRYFILQKTEVTRIKETRSLETILAKYASESPQAVAIELESYLKNKPALNEEDRLERARAYLLSGREEGRAGARELCEDALLTKNDALFLQAYLLHRSAPGAGSPPPEFLRQAGLAYAARGNHAAALRARLDLIGSDANAEMKERAFFQVIEALVNRFKDRELARAAIAFYIKAFPGGIFAKDVEFMLKKALPPGGSPAAGGAR